MTMKRRDFVTGSMASMLGLSLRSALLGVPASFLLHRTVRAATVDPKFTIIAASDRGEPMNISGPGTFPTGNNDIARRIIHPNPGQVGNVTATINGTGVNASDLANSADIRLGAQTVKAARAYTALDQGYLDHLVSFWHQSGTNAHPEFPSVLEANGALKSNSGIGPEQLPSAIAQEMAPALNTLLDTPMVLDGQFTYEGTALNRYRPTLIRSLVAENSSLPLSTGQYNALYTHTLNGLHRDLKQNGTAKQKQFLDQNLLSRRQASDLGESLFDLLQGVNDNQIGQMRAAIALIKLNVSPVIVMRHDFGRDNHGDQTLNAETTSTFQGLNALVSYWDLIQEHGLTDKVLYATLNVFGRTVTRNGRGGRDHFGLFTHAFLHGTHLNGGIIGGMVAHRNNAVKASGINSTNGSARNPDIAGGETLAALFATILAAAGVSDERIKARVPDGKVVQSALPA